MKTSSLFAGLALLALSVPTQAAEDSDPALAETLKLCATCHGEAGAEPIDPSYPILAGQHLHYLYVQLKDFKSGLRENDIMAPIVAEMERAEMLALAEHFSKQAWPVTVYRAAPEAASAGANAATAGQCVQCHLGGYEGGSGVPRLAGQQRDYLEKTMTDFMAKQRNNSPAKSALMGSYEPAQIKALAEYLAEM